jgi:hypothetical protein
MPWRNRTQFRGYPEQWPAIPFNEPLPAYSLSTQLSLGSITFRCQECNGNNRWRTMYLHRVAVVRSGGSVFLGEPDFYWFDWLKTATDFELLVPRRKGMDFYRASYSPSWGAAVEGAVCRGWPRTGHGHVKKHLERLGLDASTNPKRLPTADKPKGSLAREHNIQS